MLKVEHISTGYGKKQVLFDVSFEINNGEVLIISGGDGSGKSTLLKCIYSLLSCWTGVINYKEERINKLQPYDLIKMGIVYIPQTEFYFENLTVYENLIISGLTNPKIELKRKISEVCEITGLARFNKRKPFNLSGGERKILGFAIALMHEPNLLLLDEPFAGVDKRSSEILLSIFKERMATKENGIILVEHANELNHIYTRKLFMELGTIKNIIK